MDNFNKYLKGSQFTLYADLTPAPELGTTKTKTWNRLRTAMNDHKFIMHNCQKADLLEHLKDWQHKNNQPEITQIDNALFNDKIHVDIFPKSTAKGPHILTITDKSTAYSQATGTQSNYQEELTQEI